MGDSVRSRRCHPVEGNVSVVMIRVSRGDKMRRFWDARAREDAYYFVDSRLEYGNPDTEAFWSGGATDLGRLLDAVGVELCASDVVAEVGCGVGRLTRPLAGRVARIYALDVSAEMLRRARELNGRLTNVEWVLGSGIDLRPIPDAAVDACVSHVVFQHIPDPRITLGYVAEMGRVLKPGGWSAFQISNDAGVHHAADPRGPRQLAARLMGRAPRGRRDPAWLGSKIELEELRDVAYGAGLDVERTVNPGTQMCLVLLRRSRRSGGAEPRPDHA